jgi:hypothetical protein
VNRELARADSIRTAAPTGLSLRPITDAHLPFLADVNAATRREELAPVPWSDAEKAAFLRWQSITSISTISSTTRPASSS